MENELSQLDELNESDILEALGEEVDQSTTTLDDIVIEDFDESEDQIVIEDLNEDIINEEPASEEIINEDENIVNENIKSNDLEKTEVLSTSTDLASLLSQLLNNKTIEITIKIKD
jgi:lipopolysaccharide export LptBFGC system permease protein LptF